MGQEPRAGRRWQQPVPACYQLAPAPPPRHLAAWQSFLGRPPSGQRDDIAAPPHVIPARTGVRNHCSNAAEEVCTAPWPGAETVAGGYE